MRKSFAFMMSTAFLLFGVILGFVGVLLFQKMERLPAVKPKKRKAKMEEDWYLDELIH